MARGNHDGGKSLTDRVRKAMTRAIKQGDEGLAGQRALSDLLAELMQNDVAKFIQVTGPFIPKEIILDQSVSITLALEEARSRLIDINSLQAAPMTLEHSDSASINDQSAVLGAVVVSQGEV